MRSICQTIVALGSWLNLYCQLEVIHWSMALQMGVSILKMKGKPFFLQQSSKLKLTLGSSSEELFGLIESAAQKLNLAKHAIFPVRGHPLEIYGPADIGKPLAST